MTLTTETAKSTRTLTYFVRIYTTVGTYSGANVLLQATNPTSSSGTPGVDAIRISKSFDSPVPQCQIDLNRVSAWITRGMGVTVDAGYNGLTQRLFTGFVQSRERGVGKGTIQCMGRLWTAFRTVQIGSRSVDGVTVSSAIGTILDYVGLTDNRSLTVPAFTLGTASDPVLERMPASQMLQMLMDIDGCRIYETGTGQVIVRVIDEAPAPTSFKTYTSNDNATARVLEASDREDPEYYRNRVIVTGATVTEGSPPDETSRTITATATNTGSALVQPALPSGTYIDAEYNNHLIDTDAKAASVAIRLLAKFARIPRQIQIEVAGDPELELGQTLTFTMPELDLNDRGFISGIEHVIDRQSYVTRLTDFRGAGDTGGSLSQNPIAAFTFKSEVEVYGAQTNVVATLDASGSFDPDGTIASYAWSDNQTTTPEIATFTTKFPVVRADTSAWTGSWSVTLTVTDNDGLTGTTPITIPYKNTDAEIVIPAIYAAIKSRHSGSLDGAVTWNDSTVGSGNSISVAARPADGVNVGHACYGTSTGRIYRTTDAGATVTLVYTSAAAVAINDMQWDWRFPNLVYALDENCILYQSTDYGVTWGIHTALRTELGLAGALGNLIGLPAPFGIYVFGGTGAGSPLIAYTANGPWTRQTFTGDLLTDTVTTPGDATLRIVGAAAPTAGFGTAIILSWSSGGGASITAVYYTTSDPGPTAAYTRAATTFGGLKTGRYMVSDNPLILTKAFYCAFANRSIWASADGINWTETTNVMPATVTPRHAIGMTGSAELTGIVGMFSVFMIAASDGIYKWTVGETTASYMRGGTGLGGAMPASSDGYKLAMGAPGTTSSRSLRLVHTNDGGKETHKTSAVAWTALATTTGAVTNPTRPIAVDRNLWFVLNSSNTGSWRGKGVGSRSKDGGATWGAAVAPTGLTGEGVAHYAKDAGGRLWAVVQSGTAGIEKTSICYSDDDGDSWTTSITYGNGTTQEVEGFRVVPHPTNSSRIAVIAATQSYFTAGAGDHDGAVFVTPDRGANWTTNSHSGVFIPDDVTGASIASSFVMLPSGRIIGIWYRSSAPQWRRGYTDDYGVTWTDTGVATQANSMFQGFWTNATRTSLAYTFEVDRTGSPGSLVIWFSSDSGATWAALSPAIDWSAYQVENTSALASGFGFPQDGADEFYVSSFSTSVIKRVSKFSPVSSSGVWSDETNALPTMTPNTGGLGMAWVP